jgi:TetR/AcrR family transcriptional regulator, cholesterol catabolism regulator
VPNRIKTKASAPVWRKEDRAEHIYRVAAEIMCQKGYEATSMNDIGEAVGLTKAGVYHYIRGKEHLLFEIMSYAMDMVDLDVIGAAREVKDAEERLRLIIERHAMRILEVGGAVTVLLDEMWALRPSHRRIIKSRKRAYFDLIRDTLERLRADGKLRDVNPTVATFALLGILNWISRWYRREGKISAKETLASLVSVGMNAVLRVESARSLPVIAIPDNLDRRAR